jgi:PAS domain S-box-containing protein
MSDVAAELSTTLEQLRVAEEELRDQNDALRDAQLALEAERQRYAELFALAPVAYVVTDDYGAIQEANDVAAELLGVHADALARRPLLAFVPADDRRPVRRALNDVVHGRGIQTIEHRLAPRGRDEIIVRARIRAVPREGLRHELRWALEEVTAQRQTEVELRVLAADLEGRVVDRTAALEAERALLAAVVEQIPVGVLIVDARTRRLLASNASAHVILGEPAIDGRHGYRADGARYGVGEWPVERSLANGETVNAERIVLSQPDGSAITIEVSSAPVHDGAGTLIAAVSVFQDITARDRREAAEREFVANAAHELRTPLAAIAGAIEVLQSGAKEEPEERERFLGHIERESQRLQRRVRALLTLARAQTATEAPKLEVVPLCELVTETVESLEPQPRVPVEIGCPPELAALANRDLLERVVANLVANAAQYTSEGRIIVSVSPVEHDLVELAVADTGPGIAPEQRERMFERFFRGARDRDGFGLGLAIVSEAVRAMNGTIAVDAAEGGGTVVRVRLRGATVLDR